MLTAGAEGFGVILERHLAAAGAPAELPVIVCGMAGARQGWLEAPYVALPASLDAILAGAVPVPGQARENPHPARPRTAQHRRARRHARRGDPARRHPAAVCGGQPPRLHARHPFEMGRGRRRRHHRLPHLAHRRAVLRPVEAVDPAPFAGRKPTARPARQPGVPQRLQPGRSARAATSAPACSASAPPRCSRTCKPDDAAATLSGLLIGAEIASARRIFGEAGGKVILVASGPLALLYNAALKLAGLTVIQADADEAVRAGLFEAAKRLGWVERAAA